MKEHWRVRYYDGTREKSLFETKAAALYAARIKHLKRNEWLIIQSAGVNC